MRLSTRLHYRVFMENDVCSNMEKRLYRARFFEFLLQWEDRSLWSRLQASGGCYGDGTLYMERTKKKWKKIALNQLSCARFELEKEGTVRRCYPDKEWQDRIEVVKPRRIAGVIVYADNMDVIFRCVQWRELL